jgi:hypothetical protein
MMSQSEKVDNRIFQFYAEFGEEITHNSNKKKEESENELKLPEKFLTTKGMGRLFASVAWELLQAGKIKAAKTFLKKANELNPPKSPGLTVRAKLLSEEAIKPSPVLSPESKNEFYKQIAKRLRDEDPELANRYSNLITKDEPVTKE